MMLGMGTKLCGTRNLFTNLSKDKHAPATIVLQSMDRFPERANKESLRNIMLKHDQIFKQQVHELHRLYRVQKMLMAELRNKDVKLQSLSNTTPRTVMDTNFRYWSKTSTLENSYAYINDKGIYTLQSNSECSSLHTCNTREEASRTKNNFNLELAAKEDTARQAQATQEQAIKLGEILKETAGIKSSDLTDGECELELTLSIGCGQVKKKSRHWLCQDIELVCTDAAPSEVSQEGAEECSDFSAHFGKEGLQRPPWLIHALSLNGK